MTNANWIFLFLLNSFWACSPKEPTTQEIAPIVTGSINQTIKPDITLPAVAFRANLSPLHAPNDTADTRLVAYGGSLLAGFRDGGLFRDGQLTAIPNLIAHQMGLASFVTPLFTLNEGNGTGYLVYDQSSPLPSWKQVVNQVGVINTTPLVLSKYSGSTPDNLAMPYGIGASPADSAKVSYIYPNQRCYYAYLNRLLPAGLSDRNDIISQFMDSRKIHLLLYEPDLDTYVGMATNPDFITNKLSLHTGNGTIYYAFEKDIKVNQNLGRKVIMYNWPDIMDLPYFHLYNAATLKAMNVTSGVALEASALLIPNDKIKQAFAQRGALPITLEDKDVLSKQEVYLFRQNAFMNYDYSLPYLSKVTNNTPLVDLYTLYKKVINRQYTTEDGLFIDPSFSNGNFFSNDGIYPSAIGSAVIANETIKVINQAYKTTIPLLNVKEFASKLHQ